MINLAELLNGTSLDTPSVSAGVPTEKKKRKIKEFTYRTFFIKKKNGKSRRICAPSADLLKYQRAALPQLVEAFKIKEATLFDYEVFHGFIPGRNTVTCAELHKAKEHTITLDISNCFDSITSTMLADPSLSPKFFNNEDQSLAQGFATSPILSATYLCDPIRDLLTLVKSVDKTAVVTCYADDILISTSALPFEVLNRLIAYATYIFKKYNLTINTKKTRIRHRYYGNRKILGIQVGDETLSPNRKLKKKIRAARFQKNGPSLGGLVTASRMLLPKVRRPS